MRLLLLSLRALMQETHPTALLLPISSSVDAVFHKVALAPIPPTAVRILALRAMVGVAA